jgi:diguanylate cyclase (GGDEF)-like protein
VADVTESARLRDELHRRATVDALTGCYNRASVMDALEDTLGGEQRERAAVVFIDLDGFKAVNDRLGHIKGDDLLRTVAERIRRAIRGDDILGRIGGDEFLVLCGAVADANEALAIGNRISAALDEPVVLDGKRVPVRASVGVAHVGAVERSADELVAEADAAMYQSKRVGAGRAVLIDAR